jgi:hypothetical protein
MGEFYSESENMDRINSYPAHYHPCPLQSLTALARRQGSKGIFRDNG